MGRMAVINLKKVLGGHHFLAKFLLGLNGYGLKLAAVIDTEAGGGFRRRRLGIPTSIDANEHGSRP